MKFIRAGEPKVQIVGQTGAYGLTMEHWAETQGHPSFQFDSATEADAITEFGGRVCYMSFTDMRPPEPGLTRNETYIKNIIKVGHGSVLEHVSWNFIISGVDRNLTHELVRHRAGVAYSQLSTRYAPPDTLVVPARIFDAGGEELAGWLARAKAQFDAYKDMMGNEKKKDLREDAMAQLPGSIETKLLFTANARALRHIMYMRGSLGAKKDIRALAVKLFDLVGHHKVFGGIWKREDPEKGFHLVVDNPKV